LLLNLFLLFVSNCYLFHGFTASRGPNLGWVRFWVRVRI